MRIIVGGGIVGLTAGIAFKAIGWDMLVCERPHAREVHFSGRAAAARSSGSPGLSLDDQ